MCESPPFTETMCESPLFTETMCESPLLQKRCVNLPSLQKRCDHVYDHGYVPSTLRKIVSHMTTDMFQARYANLCHKWQTWGRDVFFN
jgi:hypothetical protein